MELINDIHFDTIRLAYGVPKDASIEEVRVAAEAAGCEGFIWQDRMYPVRLSRSIELHESALAATKAENSAD
jgi:hypothetical protein